MDTKLERISVCANEQKELSTVAERYARCEYFAVYDRNTATFSYVLNEAKDEMSGAGGKATKQLGELNVQVALVPEVGPKAYAALDAFGIKVYRYNKGTTLQNAVDQYINGELVEVTSPTRLGKH